MKEIYKIKDIKQLYDIIHIQPDHILTREGNRFYQKYIYKVIPVTLLDFSIEVQNSILMIYNEFLREMDLDMQIYISNKKMNTEYYIESVKNNIIKQGDHNFKSFLNYYLEDLKEKIQNEQIYITKYYIVITMEYKNNHQISQIDEIFLKLNKLGCIVDRVQEKEELEKIIYEHINKESMI